MSFCYEIITCQTPASQCNVARDFMLVRCEFDNQHPNAPIYYAKAWQLAQQVNPNKANNATSPREKDRLTLDALGGVLAEYGWYYYINRVFGEQTVAFTDYKAGESQIDLVLNNGKTLEVRSSFPRNGIKFAVCHEKYNFKNICNYHNLYKPSEVAKDFFACVLFETQKDKLTTVPVIRLYLVGGSTKAMMQDDRIAFLDRLVAEDDLTQTPSQYKVIKLKNALDIKGFEDYMLLMGYHKRHIIPLGVLF